MKILLLGSGGQVGTHLADALSSRHELVSLSRSDLDIADEGALRTALEQYQYDFLINAAAYTAVDLAENEPELAEQVNAVAPAVIAECCAEFGTPLIHYSTDYVFNGHGSRPYVEADETDPLGVYGRTKLKGEHAVLESGSDNLVLRTSWVYSGKGNNFYRTMLRLATERDELNIVADQVGAPTYAGSIASATGALVEQISKQGRIAGGRSGLYHMSCQGQTSWCEFARKLLTLNGYSNIRINPITTDEFPTPAKRPAYSVLDNTRLQAAFGLSMPSWEDGLARCVAEGTRE